MTDSFAFQSAQRTPELLGLIANNMRSKLPIRAKNVAILAQPLRKVEDNGLREEVVLLRQRNERLASLRLDIRGIDYGESSTRESLPNDLVQEIEGVPRCGLIVLVVRNKRAAKVRGNDLCRQEVLAGKRRLAAAGRPDEENERKLGMLIFTLSTSFWAKTAICVGAPSAASNGPTGSKRTS